MQRAQPHPSAGTEGPRRLPIMGLQIAHQGNLLFQLVERLTVHGLLASTGRIRQTALRSQARMVGAHKKCAPMAPAFTQQHKLSSRRCAHRRRVEGSGERDGSLQCGAACSTESPAMCSQACWRQGTLKCAEGASQSGKMVKVLLARMTDSASHPDPVVAWVVCLLAPLAMADDGLVATQRTPPREQLQRKRRRPRIGLVIGLWQCDKENHGWREGLPLTVAAKFRSEDPAFTLPVKTVSNEKRILLSIAGRHPSTQLWPVYCRLT